MNRKAGKIKVAIAGVGNCASSLVQGIVYYRDTGFERGRGVVLLCFFGAHRQICHKHLGPGSSQHVCDIDGGSR